MSNLIRVLSLFLILTVHLLLPSHAGAADTVALQDHTYLTEQYYPFNYCEGGIVTGLSAELLRMVWKELDINPVLIQSMPWARAYERIQHTPGTVLFSMARTENREHLFKWAGPITVARFVLIGKKSRGFSLQSLDQLTGQSIGTLRDDIADTLLRPYNDKARVQPLADMALNVAKLRDDRLDLIAYDEISWHMLAKRMQLDLSDFETVFVLQETAVNYAFNPAISDTDLRLFQQALDKVKATPAYEQIVRKYLY